MSGKPETKLPLAAIVVMGVSGSGKSTIGHRLAEALGAVYRDGDEFHPPANVAKMSSGQPLDDEDRRPWLATIAGWIEECRQAGTLGIVGCSALKRRYRDVLTSGGRPDVAIVHLAGSFELISGRLAARKGHFMPPGLLKSQFEALEVPSADENVVTVSIDDTPEGITAKAIAALLAKSRMTA